MMRVYLDDIAANLLLEFDHERLIPLMPVFADQVLGLDAAALGTLVTAAGVGSLAGSIAVVSLGGRFDQDRLGLSFGLLTATALVGFAKLQPAQNGHHDKQERRGEANADKQPAAQPCLDRPHAISRGTM